MEEIKGSIKRRNSVLYHVKWLGFPKKKDWTFEPYENFSEGARTKLLQFHINHPSAPRGHGVTSETLKKYLSCSLPFHLTINVQGPTSPPLNYPEVIDRAYALKSVRRTFPAKNTKEQQSRKHTTLPRASLHREEGRWGWRTSVTTQEKYNHST